MEIIYMKVIEKIIWQLLHDFLLMHVLEQLWQILNFVRTFKRIYPLGRLIRHNCPLYTRCKHWIKEHERSR